MASVPAVEQPDPETFASPSTTSTGVSNESRAAVHRARQAALLELGRQTVACADTSALLKGATEFCVEMLKADLGLIGELATETEDLRIELLFPTQTGKDRAAKPRQLTLSTEGSHAVSAIRAKTPLVLTDLAQDSRYCDPLLEEFGVRAGLVVPLLNREDSIGALGLYWKQVRETTPDDVNFVETIAHMLSLSLNHASTRTAIDCERAVVSTVLDLVEAPVVVVDAQGRVFAVNWACSQATGQKTTRVKGELFWDVFAVDEEQDALRAVTETVAESAIPCQFDGHLLTMDGRCLPVNWLLREVCDQNGAVKRIVLVGQLSGGKSDTGSEPDDKEPSSPPEDGSQEKADSRPEPFQCRPSPAVVERRSSPRRCFPYSQRIAPYNGHSIPPPEDFRPVVCHDISAGGFSFFQDERPDFTELVIVLGEPPHVTRFFAEVRGVRESQVNGRQQFLIGCQFRDRIPS